MDNSNIIELIKFHNIKKKYLSRTFNITMKQIQSDVDVFITYIKSLNKTTATASDILTFAQNNTDTFFYKMFDWTKDNAYQTLQCQYIISEKSVMFSSNNDMLIITPEV